MINRTEKITAFDNKQKMVENIMCHQKISPAATH
jgi:hypothetical protein